MIQRSTAQSIYINAKIYDGSRLIDHDAFLIKGGRFVELGRAEKLLRYKLADCPIIDLKHRLVLPGFIESHAHILGLGQSRVTLDLRNLNRQEIVEKVGIQSTNQTEDSWIIGRGWDQNNWENKDYPHRQWLKHIKQPVFLRRVDGHAVWINDAAIKAANIGDLTKSPPGGQIIRDCDHKATGVLIDNAINLVTPYVDKLTTIDLKYHFDLACQEALSLGITSFHDAGASADAIALFINLAKNHQLPLRLNVMIDGEDQDLVNNFLERGPMISDFLIIRTIKYFADGALGSRGAALLAPYHDKPLQHGLMLIDKVTLATKTTEAINRKFQVATHAIGDAACRTVLDAYEQALSLTSDVNARLRIEHAQLVDPQDHHRFSKLNIIASMQPIHCIKDMMWLADRLGSDRIYNRAYPWRSLLNLGTILAFGSDAPVEDINPILGLYAAVTRTDFHGSPQYGFMPEQKLTFDEALNAYYAAAAFAEFNEHQKGKIANGFFADFVVFDTDLFCVDTKQMLAAKPLMTVVDGNIAFNRLC